MKKSTNIIIKIFAFVLVFFSNESISKVGTNFYYDVGFYFNTGIINPKFLSPFIIIFLVLLFNILTNNKVVLKFGNGIFMFALLAYLFKMLNPNANPSFPILGLPLIANISEYIFLFMLLVFTSISESLNKVLLEKIFRDVVFFSIIRAIILIIIFFFGTVTTVRWGSYSIILDEADIQLLFSFIGAMLFALYLLTNKAKYLFISLLLLGIIFLSMQRSTALPGFLAVFLLILITIAKVIPTAAKKSFSIAALFVILFPLMTIQFPDSKMSFAINRFVGIAREEKDVSNVAFGDTGHKEQAIATLLSAWEDAPFFGLGYGNFKSAHLEGQTKFIHNCYASTWVKNGIVSLLFYLSIFVIVIKHTIKLTKKINKNNYQNYLLRLTASYYLIGYFVAASFMAPDVFGGFRYQIFWFLIFIYVTRYPETLNIKNKYA